MTDEKVRYVADLMKKHRRELVAEPLDRIWLELAEVAIGGAAGFDYAFGPAKPKEAEGLKFGSRLTVEGVEAVVVSMATIEAHEKLIAELRSSIDALLDDRERRAMLSAAGDGTAASDVRGEKT
ncbi:hypothetical protein ASE66_12490 [Bosea sp. Root483D1]|uniref:hypothetical protein n=1 Tax=Bosea sp. Root483D1 TaxID=1736544 RepID=UPI000708B425|nr:hypothetical protein [Bosea sp. Root483D1]KRE15657.1 hypothetical protein ASE66_12490 [Bosea sp. Root483D1]